MSRLALVAAFLLAGLTSGCDSSDTQTPAEPFSLTVEVQTADGRPATGYSVQVHYEPADDAAAPPTAARGGGFFMSAVFPTPWQTVARVQYQLPTAVDNARIEWFDVAGVRVRTTDILPTDAGQISVALPAENEAGVRLPGGLYRLVSTFGADTAERWTILSDAYADNGWTRTLGRTGADGTVRTDDPAAAPALFDPPAVVRTDAQGNELGVIRAPSSATVEVLDADGGVLAAQTVTLADDANRVTVRL